MDVLLKWFDTALFVWDFALDFGVCELDVNLACCKNMLEVIYKTQE